MYKIVSHKVSIQTLTITWLCPFQDASSCSTVHGIILYFMRLLQKLINIGLIKELPFVTRETFLGS